MASLRRRLLHRLGASRSDESGVTLVELLVVLVLITVIGAMVSNSVITALGAGRRGQARVYALTNLETAAQRVSRELRAADPVSAATDDSVRVTVYRDGGRSIYTYTVEPPTPPETRGTLVESVDVYADETTTVIDRTYTRPVIRDLDQSGVTTFTYTKAGGDPWAPGVDPESEIARVNITLVRDLAEQAPITVETSLFVRNSS